jgi:hypothetical protein
MSAPLLISSMSDWKVLLILTPSSNLQDWGGPAAVQFSRCISLDQKLNISCKQVRQKIRPAMTVVFETKTVIAIGTSSAIVRSLYCSVEAGLDSPITVLTLGKSRRKRDQEGPAAAVTLTSLEFRLLRARIRVRVTAGRT